MRPEVCNNFIRVFLFNEPEIEAFGLLPWYSLHCICCIGNQLIHTNLLLDRMKMKYLLLDTPSFISSIPPPKTTWNNTILYPKKPSLSLPITVWHISNQFSQLLADVYYTKFCKNMYNNFSIVQCCNTSWHLPNTERTLCFISVCYCAISIIIRVLHKGKLT